MDVERFARELPLLFDDFPASPQPKGRRFDDILDSVRGIACENNLALVNLAASSLEPGETYLEIGSYMGASLIGAMRGNGDKDFVAIDRFSFPSAAGRFPEPTREILDTNLERFGDAPATILEGDAFEVLASGALAGRTVGALFYDADHSYEAQLRALRDVEPYLAPRAILIADNADKEEVAGAIRDFVAEEPRAELLFDVPGRSRDSPHWWDGVKIVAWNGR